MELRETEFDAEFQETLVLKKKLGLLFFLLLLLPFRFGLLDDGFDAFLFR